MADQKVELKHLKMQFPTLGTALSRGNLKSTVVRGVRMTVVSTAGVFLSNVLNAYMVHHELGDRIFSVTMQPNPLKTPNFNPNRKTTGGSFQ